MADTAALVEELSKLTVIEAADLVKKLEEKWGVTAAAFVAVSSNSFCSRLRTATQYARTRRSFSFSTRFCRSSGVMS